MQAIFPQDLVKFILDDLSDAYHSDDRPWVAGYSGRKDSAALFRFTKGIGLYTYRVSL